MKTFEKAAHTYDDVTSLHRQLADQLMNQLRGISPAKIIDIGCGTGYLTALLKKQFPQASVMGVDIAPSMIQLASLRDARINWVVADARQLPNEVQALDLIVSNGAYQWIAPLEQSLSCAHRRMVTGGVFIANIFGYHTCCELIDAFTKAGVKVVRRLPQEINIVSALTEAGFRDVHIDTRLMKECFDDPVALLRWLKAMGANRLDQYQVMGKGRFQQALDMYPRNDKGTIDVTIEVITVRAIA